MAIKRKINISTSQGEDSYEVNTSIDIVQKDVAISECIKIMQNKKIGSLLISDYDGEIIGIFTERDLVYKHNFFQKWNNLNRPISDIMSSPVTTVRLKDIDRAASIMMDKKIRHLPIIDELTKKIVGIVSMRDLFEHFYNLSKGTAIKKKESIIEGFVEKTKGDLNYIKKIMSGLEKHDSKTYTLEEFLNGKTSANLFFFDIDKLDFQMVLEILQIILSNENLLAIFLHESHFRKTNEYETLSSRAKEASNIALIEKPIQVFKLTEFIRNFFNK